MEGKEVGEYTLNDAVFAIEPSQASVHTVITAYLANQRQGTQSALTRAEVRGGGKKPWRQKGTGRARQGSTRSPQWTGGGVAFAPKPRDYRTGVNKKIRKLAVKSVLSSKVSDIMVLDEIKAEEIKTKTIVNMLKSLGADKKTLIVLPENDQNVLLSARNLPDVKTTFVGALNAYELLNCEKILLARAAADIIGEVYSA
jgi:large subunit ribosomal protein L4